MSGVNDMKRVLAVACVIGSLGFGAVACGAKKPPASPAGSGSAIAPTGSGGGAMGGTGYGGTGYAGKHR